MFQSIAVVGLLHQMDTYFDILLAQVQYLDTLLNNHIVGEMHNTGNDSYMAKSKRIFTNKNFWFALWKTSPAIAVLEHLYNVAIEVNIYQV